jgi:hypothetical protein
MLESPNGPTTTIGIFREHSITSPLAETGVKIFTWMILIEMNSWQCLTKFVAGLIGLYMPIAR